MITAKLQPATARALFPGWPSGSPLWIEYDGEEWDCYTFGYQFRSVDLGEALTCLVRRVVEEYAPSP